MDLKSQVAYYMGAVSEMNEWTDLRILTLNANLGIDLNVVSPWATFSGKQS